MLLLLVVVVVVVVGLENNEWFSSVMKGASAFDKALNFVVSKLRATTLEKTKP